MTCVTNIVLLKNIRSKGDPKYVKTISPLVNSIAAHRKLKLFDFFVYFCIILVNIVEKSQHS